MKYVLILWMTYTTPAISVTSAEFNSLADCAAAGELVKEKAPKTIPGTPNVQWVCGQKGAE